MYFIFVNCTIFSWLQKHYMLIMESMESIEKQKEKQETRKEEEMEGRRREGERMGSIDEGKRGREKKIKEGKEKKTLNFPEEISINIFMYILSNVYYVISLKIATYRVGWMDSFIVYFFIMNKTYPMPLISYLSV